MTAAARNTPRVVLDRIPSGVRRHAVGRHALLIGLPALAGGIISDALRPTRRRGDVVRQGWMNDRSKVRSRPIRVSHLVGEWSRARADDGIRVFVLHPDVDDLRITASRHRRRSRCRYRRRRRQGRGRHCRRDHCRRYVVLDVLVRAGMLLWSASM